MPQGPWERFQGSETEQPQGPWEKFAAPGPTGPEIAAKARETLPKKRGIGAQVLSGVVEDVLAPAAGMVKEMAFPQDDALGRTLGPGAALVRPMIESGKEAVRSAKEGRYADAAGHALAINPFAPMIEMPLRTAIVDKEPWRAAAQVGTMAALPKVAKGAGKVYERTARPFRMRGTKGFPGVTEKGGPTAARGAEDVFRAAAPTEMQQGFRANIEAAAGDLAEIGKKVNLKEKAGGIKNPYMRFDAAEKAIRDHLKQMYEQERAPQIQRHADQPVPVRFGVDASEGLQFLRRSAGETGGRSLATGVAESGGAIPLAEADALARLVNKELIPFERKTGTQQVVTQATSRRIASLKALDRELSEAINKKLAERGEGGIREYERRSAALHDIADRIGRRSQAVELQRRIPGLEWLRALIGGKPAIASASQAAISSLNPGRVLQRGFRRLSESPLEPIRPQGTGISGPLESLPIPRWAYATSRSGIPRIPSSVDIQTPATPLSPSDIYRLRR